MDYPQFILLDQGDFFEFLWNGKAHWGVYIDSDVCVYAELEEVSANAFVGRKVYRKWFPCYVVKVTNMQHLVLTGQVQQNSQEKSKGIAIAVKALKHIGSRDWRSSKEFVDSCKENIWHELFLYLLLILLSIVTPKENSKSAGASLLVYPVFTCVVITICAFTLIYKFLTTKRTEFLSVKKNPFTGIKQDFMKKYLMEDVKKFNSSHIKVAEIKVTPELFIMTGKKGNIWSCENLVQYLTTAIDEHNLQLEMFGIQEYLRSAEGIALIKKLETEHRCMMNFVWDVQPETKKEANDVKGKSVPPCGWDFNSIKVRVIQGEIDRQKTDVIVSTVDKSLNLNFGTMASSVLRAAGDIIQIELLTRYKIGIGVGDFAQSSGGMLPCDYILHVCLPYYRPDNIRQILHIISRLLDRAEILKAKSISFPALGTGILRYPPDISAEIVMEAIRLHAEKNTHALQSVNIVVFPKDKKCFDAVLAKGSTLFNDNPRNLNNGIFEVKDHVFQSGQVFFKIQQGDITQQNTDVIVNGLKDSLDLASSGQASVTLLEKCGQSLQKECNLKKNEMSLKGVIVTSAPNLFCQHIVHISLNKFDHSMDRGILMAFREAEKLGAKSVALPALQSASNQMKAKTMKKLIFQSLKQFSVLEPQNLTEIKLVTNNPGILNEFLKHESRGRRDTNTFRKSTPVRSISEKLSVQIYSIDAHGNEEIGRKLQERCALAYNDLQKEESNLHLLDDSQIENLKNLGFECKTKVDISCQDGSVKLQGFDFGGISQVYGKLKEMTKAAEETSFKKSDSFNIPFNRMSEKDRVESSRPTLQSIEWMYGEGKNWNKYEPLLNSEIEKEYQNKASHFTRQDANGNKYFIDFTRMIEICLNGNGDNKSTSKIKRQTKTKDLTKTQSWPKYWDLMSEKKNLEVIELKQESLEYKEVEKHFKLSLLGSSVFIRRIQRIQNKSLFLQFCAKKDELELHNPENHPNERKLFHGTSPYSINQINENGFNRSFCGKNGTAYGQGVYFANESSYSLRYAEPDLRGNSYMYRARVLTGQFIATSPDTKCPPKKPGTNRPYDSGGNKNQGIFVIFHDAQMYPEYLITYQCHHLQEMMSGPTRKLKAVGLPSDITQIRLKTFFSNENSQGGGPVEDVQISGDRTSAIITFKEVEAVERIIKRKDTVSMSSVFVKVSPCFDEIPNNGNDNLADEMKAIKSKSMELEMFGEANNKTTMTNIDTKGPNLSAKDLSSKDLSLENCHKPQSSSTNLNTDLSSENCQDDHVISLDRHVVADDTQINKDTEMTLKDELPVYSNLIYLQGDLGNLEKLAEQITALLGLHVDDIIQQDLPDRCIVAFMADFNLEEILMEGNGLTLGSKQLIAKPVFNTNSILVNGLSEKVNVSSLKACLKNKVLSGGGQMKSLEEINQDKQAVVYFERSIDADDILFLKQELEIEGETLFLSKYFPCLSEVKFEAEDGFTPEIPLAISVQKNLLSQIETKNKNKQIYHGRLRKVISLYSDWEAISSREQLNVSGVTIKNFGIHEFLQRADGQELIGRIQEKHGCIIKVVPNPKMNFRLGGPGRE
ncbi:poly [ADP-ribose] polymerase 14, partial [Biomphalaria pfeifferi]